MIQTNNTLSTKILKKSVQTQCATVSVRHAFRQSAGFFHMLTAPSSSNQISTKEKIKINELLVFYLGNYLYLLCTDPKDGKFLLK